MVTIECWKSDKYGNLLGLVRLECWKSNANLIEKWKSDVGCDRLK